jgi:hypothetical protein
VNGWDEALREAKVEGEALVVRGDLSDLSFEVEVVALRDDVEDPYLDACERAFSPHEDSRQFRLAR